MILRILALAAECFLVYFVLGFLAAAAWLSISLFRDRRATALRETAELMGNRDQVCPTGASGRVYRA